MIISRTPYRISFLGGGTDLPAFYAEEEGAVISTAIDKYIHITVNDRFDETYRLSYSKTEIVESIDQIDHKIFRRVLEKYGAASREANGQRGLELVSIADIPAGTGLGSSSSFTVGLLHALKSHLGIFQSEEDLAAEASEIEIQDLGEPIGKQDQYAAAYGGLSYIRFLPSGEVVVEPLVCSKATRTRLEKSLLIFYTGMTRSASDVFGEISSNVATTREPLREMKRLATRLKRVLETGGASAVPEMGRLLDEGWRLKKSLASGITVPQIDDWYARALAAGATGGKILGAGGGGFLMVVCEPEKQASVREELKELRQIPVGLESLGSRIIFVG